MRLKDAAHINRKVLPETTDPDFTFRYIDISAVDEFGGMRLPGEQTRFADAPSRARRIAPPGSTVVSTVRTYLRAIAQVPASDESLVFSTGFAVLEARPLADDRFLSYVCRSEPFIDEVVARSVGVSYPAINPGELGSIEMSLPSLDGQRRIADFLDAETARIDKMASLRFEQQEQLRQRRWSLLQSAINGTSIGHLPLRRMVDSIIDGPFGSAFSSSDYSDEGAAVVRLGNIGFCEYRMGDQARIPMDLFREFRKHEVRGGDILIAGLGDPRNHAGRACVAPDLGPAIVKGKCFRVRANLSKTSADFLALILSSPMGAAALEGRGSTRSMINLEIVKSAVLPFPCFEEQVAIAREMDLYWQGAQAAIQACERQLAILAERRQALITAAVKGGITV